jgi:hypothetical protein
MIIGDLGTIRVSNHWGVMNGGATQWTLGSGTLMGEMAKGLDPKAGFGEVEPEFFIYSSRLPDGSDALP